MAKIIVEVCAGTHCTLMGSMDIMDAVASLAEIKREMGNSCEIEVRAVPCLTQCKNGISGPIVIVDGQVIEQAESESVMSAIMERCQCSDCQ